MAKSTRQEEFSVKGEEVLKKVKELIKEGNIRRIIIKDKNFNRQMICINCRKFLSV